MLWQPQRVQYLQRHPGVVGRIQQLAGFQRVLRPVRCGDALGLDEALVEQDGHRRLDANGALVALAAKHQVQIEQRLRAGTQALAQLLLVLAQAEADLDHAALGQHLAHQVQAGGMAQLEHVGG